MNKKNLLTLLAIALTSMALTFCHKDPKPSALTDSPEVPELPDKPYDYPSSSNDYLAALGRVLFYEKEMSANKNISCGSCHQQARAFTDNLQFSPGTNNEVTKRNTPSIFPKNGRLFWDGRVHSISELALRPVTDAVEMGIRDLTLLQDRIASIDYYQALFRHAFPKSNKIDTNMIKTALEEFIKNFHFSDNKFNRARRGETKLSASEQMGQDLFFGKAKCSNCHNIEQSGQNNGYGVTDISHNIGLDEQPGDPGVGGVRKDPNQNGAFMMPVLLNIEFTAPYMHDGRFATLEEVVEHYNSEIKMNPSLSHILRDPFNFNKAVQLNLNDQEKTALVDFLKTLSDPRILTDRRFSDPFVPRHR